MTRRQLFAVTGAMLIAPALGAQKKQPTPKGSSTVTLVIDGMT